MAGLALPPEIVSDFGGVNNNVSFTNDNLPTFNANGQLLGNLTSAQGQQPVAAPALPSFDGETLPLGGSATTSGPSNATSSTTPASPSATSGNPTAATGSSTASNWFARAAIVILGFVFVAVGLSQFGRGQNVIRAVLNRRV